MQSICPAQNTLQAPDACGARGQDLRSRLPYLPELSPELQILSARHSSCPLHFHLHCKGRDVRFLAAVLVTWSTGCPVQADLNDGLAAGAAVMLIFPVYIEKAIF